jgi:hypothetical protein
LVEEQVISCFQNHAPGAFAFIGRSSFEFHIYERTFVFYYTTNNTKYNPHFNLI